MFTEIVESSPLIHQVGWAMIHSLWQAALLALLLAVVLKLLRNSSSNARYIAACATLALMLVCPLATATLFNANSTVPTASEEINLPTNKTADGQKGNGLNLVDSGVEQVPIAQIANPVEHLNFVRRAESFFPLMITLWLLGVSVFGLRLGIGLIHTRRLVKRAADLRDSALISVLDDLTLRLKIKKTVRIFESLMVKVPMTIGWLYPVILLPPSTLLGLTPQQLQSIIAHELAHIKRYDFLVNLMQAVVETLLFYHPAARWVSKKIRREREFACDDLTLSLCGNALIYARALANVARLSSEAGHLTTAATGGDLTSRIHRLVMSQPRRNDFRLPSFYSIFVVSLLFLIVFLGLAFTFQFDTSDRIGSQDNAAIQASDESDIPSEITGLKLYGDDLAKENLQYRKIAVEALEGHRGSAIIMNPQTGQIYTIVNQDWAIRRGWSPASTFKIVTTVAALEENLVKNSEKGIGYDSATRLNLTRAIAFSDNHYFKTLGKQVGAESLVKYAKLSGLGVKTGINYDDEINGFVPENNGDKNTWLGVSGGEVEVTPLQLAVFTSAIANGGKILVPQAVKNNQSIVPQERSRILLSPNTWAELKKGLREAVENGTGNAAGNSENAVAGKTGTIMSKESGIGLFTSYLQNGNDSLVVVVALEGKMERGAIAARVAGKIYSRLDELEN